MCSNGRTHSQLHADCGYLVAARFRTAVMFSNDVRDFGLAAAARARPYAGTRTLDIGWHDRADCSSTLSIINFYAKSAFSPHVKPYRGQSREFAAVIRSERTLKDVACDVTGRPPRIPHLHGYARNFRVPVD